MLSGETLSPRTAQHGALQADAAGVANAKGACSSHGPAGGCVSRSRRMYGMQRRACDDAIVRFLTGGMACAMTPEAGRSGKWLGHRLQDWTHRHVYVEEWPDGGVWSTSHGNRDASLRCMGQLPGMSINHGKGVQ